MSYVIRVTDIKVRSAPTPCDDIAERPSRAISRTYFLSPSQGDVCVSFFLMWPEGAERGKYAAGQVPRSVSVHIHSFDFICAAILDGAIF